MGLPPENWTLNRHVGKCLKGLPEGRNVIGKSEQGVFAAILRRETANDDLRLHIGMWTAGEAASTVTGSRGRRNMDVSALPPPQDSDFLTSDGMVLLARNCQCQSKIAGF